jgi:acyl-CoA synthetase (AMP-forming)/AMP-acid ligase II
MTQPGGGRAVLARDAAIACGLPVGNTAIEVRSETGAVCGDEEIGRIFVNGGGVASGYLKAGDIAAFSDDGWLDTDDIEACAREAIGEAGSVTAEVAIECDVHFVGRRALPRTSSGKISRAAAKTAYLDGSLARL